MELQMTPILKERNLTEFFATDSCNFDPAKLHEH